MERNVHTYDASLSNIQIKTTYTIEHKIEVFNRLLLSLIQFGEGVGLDGLKLVIKDTATASNFLVKDSIYADDVLMEIALKLETVKDDETTSNICNLLIEQMSDMMTKGTCSSGRVVRLLQIYNICNDLE